MYDRKSIERVREIKGKDNTYTHTLQNLRGPHSGGCTVCSSSRYPTGRSRYIPST